MKAPSSSELLRRRSDARAHALARRFGDALRAGEGLEAERVVEDALSTGLEPDAVQSLVIEPAMVRIGELWESQHISVADEHLATSISQRALVRLFEALTANRKGPVSRERVLLAAVEGQHHLLGMRMIADVLEGAGFDVLFLGGNVPTKSLRAFVEKHRPAVVGLAYGISVDVSHLADAIWTIHQAAPDVRIMLGGQGVPPGLRESGYPSVESSMDVVAVVEALLASSPQPLPAAVGLLRSDSAEQGWPRESAIEIERDAVTERLSEAAGDAVDLARVHVRRSETYRALALRDPVTEMPNRRAFEDELISRAEQPDGGMVVLIDIDSFKKINDEYGHDVGDEVLRSTGRFITDSVRPGDLAARIGGDEFAALLPGGSAPVARKIGERIREAAAANSSPTITVSVGIARLGTDARAAMLAADTALYESKVAGRNRVSGPERSTGPG